MNAPADPIQAFCEDHHSYNDISVARRKLSLRVLRDFEAHIPGPVLELDADQLRAYLAMLVTDRQLHPNTVRQYLNVIKTMIRWAWARRLISAENLLELREVKPPRGASPNGTPRPYTSKDLERFWPEMQATYPWGKKGHNTIEHAHVFVERWLRGTSRWNRVQPYAKRLQAEAIIALALYGGLRRDEIFNLDLEELHPDNEYLVVRSKKNRQGEFRARAVPWMSEDMIMAVTRWLEFRDLLHTTHDRPWLSLYQAHYLKPMRHRKFEMMLHDIGSGWEFHRMRHTAATVMLRTGVPLENVQKIIGHATLEQTLVYAKIDHTDTVRAARRVTADFQRAFKRPVDLVA